MLLEIPLDIIYQIYSYLPNKKLRELLYISKTNNSIIVKDKKLYIKSQIYGIIYRIIGFDYFGMSYGFVNKLILLFHSSYKFDYYKIYIHKLNKYIYIYPKKRFIKYNNKLYKLNLTFKIELKLQSDVYVFVIHGYRNKYIIKMKNEGPRLYINCPKMRYVYINNNKYMTKLE
tara:strand:+ start:853 stop:1371 length:519 start_codon:yes stop_codon:yes gene_type:complete